MKKNTQKIEKQIKSINKIFKISKAMKIISSMNIIKLQPKIKENKIVLSELKSILRVIFHLKRLKLPIFSKKKDKTNKIINIIFSSDLGLCGGYNNDLFQYVLTNKKFNNNFIVIGKKGINFFNYHNKKIIWSEILENFNWKKIKELLNLILNYKNNTKFNVVYVGLDKNIKPFIEDFQIYPFESNKEVDIIELESYKIEPTVEAILDKSIIFYLEILLLKIKDEAKYTEEISRRFAMETANDNAKEMITDLKLKYNRLRQEKITKEIINISQND